LAGTYFTFRTYNGGEIGYYVWFKVDGAGADPAVPGITGIEVDLLSTDTDTIVAQKIRMALNGWQLTTVLTVAGSSVPAGSYFTLNSTTTEYYVWYKVSGAGTDPAPSGKKGIQVDILTDDTAAQVASKTQAAINRKYFASPDLRGLFLRGQNNTTTIDPGVRYSLVPGVIGTDTLGTFELSANLSHFHTTGLPGGNVQVGTGQSAFRGGEPVIEDINTDSKGGVESRPVNANVNYAILY
jgi:hypothetical protein